VIPGGFFLLTTVSLVDGKAVEQPIATRAAQVGLRAAAVRTARGMRRVPRPNGFVVAWALQVGVPEHGRTFCAARPILTRHILVRREGGAVSLGARQNVMTVRPVAVATNDLALFAECRLLADSIAAVQLRDIFGNR
jgi:hypothetical protein